MAMKVLKNKACNCLWESKVVDIGILIPTTLPQIIVEVVKVVGLGLKRTAIIPQVIKEVIGVSQF